jgi:predicted  nucleic acid-binding Zn-ribbon protein
MAEPLEVLIEVQAHDTMLDQLHHRIEALPERSELRAVEERRGALAAELAKVQATVDDLAGRQRHLEERIAAAADRRHVIEQRMRSGDMPMARDLEAMDHEVQQLGARQAEFEDEEIALLEEEEPFDARLSEHRAAVAALDAERDRLQAAVAEAEQGIRAGIAEEESRRAACAADLPADLAQRYEFLRSRLGGVGAARLVGERCDGCHLTLPSVDVERIRNLPPEQFATCPQCDRILVR